MTIDEIKKLIEVEKGIFWETETKGKEINDVMKFAIDKAYLDMQPRTIKGHGKVKDLQDSVCKMLKKEFTECFMQSEKDEEAFKKEHHRMCTEFLKVANGKLECYGVEKLSYGKAQKVVNMIFKYLYCTKEYGEEKKGYFSYCHMPLDRYSLEWVYRALIKDNNNLQDYKELKLLGNGVYTKKGGCIKKDAIGSWSSLEYESESEFADKCTYSFYEKLLQEFTEKYNVKISPLDLDFYVWPRMQMILSAEAFMKTFKDEKNNDEEKSDIPNNESSQNKEKANEYALEKLDETLQKKLEQVKAAIESVMTKTGETNE